MAASLDRALVLYQQSRFDLAERELRQTLAEDPDSPLAHALLSFCLSGRKRHDEAIGEAERAVALAPGLPLVHHALASALYHQDKLTEAESAIGEAIRLDPTEADYFALLASIHLEQRRPDDARKAAEEGLAADPEHVGCANLRAMALVKLGRKHEAGATIEGALAKDPQNALTHANQGWTLLHQGDHRKALEHFREALRLDPELEWARVGIVEALKAKHLIYRVMLRYFLWMSTLSDKARWVVVLAVFFGPRVLVEIGSQAGPVAKSLFFLLALGLLGFVYLTWVADPLFNLFLRVNKFGRYALSREQVRASNWVGACLLGALVAPAILLAVKPWLAPFGSLMFLGLILPVSATFRCRAAGPFGLMALYTTALAVVGVLALALWATSAPILRDPSSWARQLPELFVLGVVVSTWLAAGLARPA
jgi:tetratricopeptide (TPR) repeat protein